MTLPLEGRPLEGRVRPPPPAKDPLVGAMLGHFRVVEPIGHGGMGAVYRAWDTSLERDVALKTLLFESPAGRRRFFREARTQAKLRHPHVVPIHFIGDGQSPEGRSLAYLVMDLIEGESLASLLRRQGRMNEERALDLVDAVASALEAAQSRGLVHRDVKPSNVLIDRDGHVLLADFGLAKQVNLDDLSEQDKLALPLRSGDLTADGVIIGTPAYIAPEQARGEPVDHRADIYALGVTLYELLTGQPPFTARSNAVLLAQHQADHVPPPDARAAVAALALRMLAKDPNARFGTYAELRAAIAAARPRPMAQASFFPRAAAFAIDFIPLALVAALVDRFVLNRLGWIAGALVLALVEARLGGTTPGKKLMDLQTVDARDRPPSRAVCVTRTLFKMWGPITAALVGVLVASSPGRVRIGISAPGTTSSTPSTSATIVTDAILAAWLLSMTLAFGRRRLTLHDRVTHTRVVSTLGS